MRETVDRELRKISDLYQDRCRDYAQMVSDECEGEVSKAATGEVPGEHWSINRSGHSGKKRKAIQDFSEHSLFVPSIEST